MSESNPTVGPHGYDYFADVSGARSLVQTMRATLGFQAALTHLERIERTVGQLPGRLAVLNQRGALTPPALGDEIARLTERVALTLPEVRETIEDYQGRLDPELARLEAAVARNDEVTAEEGYEPHAEAIVETKAAVDAHKERVDRAEEAVQLAFREVANQTRALEREIARLERAVAQLDEALFRPGPGEALVAADPAKLYLGRDEVQSGKLFLTTSRLIFEQDEEVTIRGRLLPLARRERRHRISWECPLDRITRAAVEPAGTGPYDRPSLGLTLQGPVGIAQLLPDSPPDRWLEALDRARDAA